MAEEMTPQGSEPRAAPVVGRYVGAGEFHHGIPARDLTQADIEALPAELLTVVSRSALYGLLPDLVLPAAPEPAPVPVPLLASAEEPVVVVSPDQWLELDRPAEERE